MHAGLVKEAIAEFFCESAMNETAMNRIHAALDPNPPLPSFFFSSMFLETSVSTHWYKCPISPLFSTL